MSSVSQHDLARRLGISQRAVSMALRSEPGVSAELRGEVLRLAGELGYRRNSLARALLEGRTRVIGILFPTFGGFFFSELLDAIQDRLNAHGFRTILCRWNRVEDSDAPEIDTLLEHRVDGVMVIPKTALPWQGGVYDALRKRKVRTVFINQHAPFPEIGAVLSDDFHGVALAVRHLLSLGHRRIAYVGPAGERAATGLSAPDANRLRGFCTTMAEAGYPPEPASLLGESGVALLTEIMKTQPDLTAFVCYSDYHALRVFEAAQACHRRIPEELSVVGHGNTIEFPHHLRVPLTTVDQPRATIGKAAVDMLLSMIEKNALPREVQVPVRLIIRASTGPCPQTASPVEANAE